MKRVISFLLTVALLFGLVGTTGIQVFAEGATAQASEYVERVSLTGMPEMVFLGEPEVPDVSVTEGGCYVTDVSWTDQDKQPVNYFQKDHEYYLKVCLRSDDHLFGYSYFITDPDTYHRYGEIEYVSESESIAYFRYPVIPLMYGYTDYVGCSLPFYRPGSAIPEVPEVTPVGGTVVEAYWKGARDENGSEVDMGTHFQEGTYYELSVVIAAPEGMPFSPDAFDANNVDCDWSGCGGYFNETYTEIRIDIDYTPRYRGTNYAQARNVPEEIQAGPAQIPELTTDEEMFAIGDVYWTNAAGETVTTLEEGGVYFLVVQVNTKSNWCISEDAHFSSNVDPYDYERISDSQMIARFRYSLEPDTGMVEVHMGELQVDMPISQVIPTVTGNATLKEVVVHNQTTGQDVTEGVFEKNCIYFIHVVLEAKEGYRFKDLNLQVYPSGNASYGNTETEAYFTYCFSTCEVIPEVEITVTPPVAGGAVADAVPSVEADALYEIKNYSWYNTDTWEVAEDTFLPGYEYEIAVTLMPKTGYAFDENTTAVYVNGDNAGYYMPSDSVWAEVFYTFSYGVGEVYLENLPEEIKAGTAKLPTLEDAYGQVTVSKVRWVNTSKSKVSSFANGKVYYLEVTLKPIAGKNFNTQEHPNSFVENARISEWKYNSDQELVLYFRYSLEPDVGKVVVTPSALAVGMDVSQITAAVTGKATLAAIEVRDLETYEVLTSGQLQENANYCITYRLVPKAGYRLGGETEVTVNADQSSDCHQSAEYVEVYVYFSTCQKITQAQVTLEGVEVGKNIADVQAVVPEGAPYSVRLQWYDATEDWNSAVGTFQDLHKYELQITLLSADGYVFDSEVRLTINGETFTQRTSGVNTGLSAWEYFNFMRPIEKVEFPALPTSIKKGQTLPTDYAAPEDAPYTIVAEWALANSGEVTTVNKNGSYVLRLLAEPKDGYRLSEDTLVYVDGQLTNNFIPDEEDLLFIHKAYNIGLTEIKRVDITMPIPTTGAKPGKATVSSSAKYTLEDMDWGCNADGSLSIDSVDTFVKDEYIFICPALKAKSGYAFASNVEVYVNGVKLDIIRGYNVGAYLQNVMLLGQVIDMPTKLEAPSVSVSGNTLYWEDNGAAAYEIYRATSKSGKYTLLDTVTTEEPVATFAARAGSNLTFEDESAVAGKTYYYKVKAISPAGSKYNSGYSAVSSVAYEFAAPAISVEMNYTTGKTVITWEKVTGAKSYDVYRATEVDGTYTKLGNTKANTYTDTKAAAGVVYYYKVVTVGSSSVYNSDGSNIYMSYAVLAQPQVKSAVDKATGKPVISWAAIADAAGYRIFRQLPGEEAFTVIATQTELRFLDATAPLDTLCTYYVQAIAADETFNSIFSNQVTATVALGVPSLQGNVNYYGQPSFHWQLVEGAVKYEIYRSTKSATKGFSLYDTKEDGNAFCDENAVAGTTYYYKVVALGQVSKSEESAAVKLTATCAVPEADNTIDQKTGRPMIYWEKVDGAKSYDIYYATSATGTFKKLANTKSTSYIDTKISVGATRYYKVRAVAKKSAGNSDFGRVMTGMCFCASPTVKISVDTVTGKPTLSWGKVSGASSYRIFRVIIGVESDFVELTSVTGTSFKDITAPTDARCAYMVQAMHKQEGLSSAFSPVVEAVSGIARPAFKGSIDAATGAFCLTWDAVEGAVKYEIYRSTSSKKGFTLVGTVEGLNFEDPSAPGKTYYYKVIAVGQVSKCSDPTALKLVGKCAQTTASAETDMVSGKPVITWEAVSGAKKYEVYRATSENGKYSKVGTTTKLSYTDTKASVGKTYYYKVVAMGSSSSSKSAMSAATAPVATIVAQPSITVKNDSKTGKLTVSWKKLSGATQYAVVYVDVTDYIGSANGPTEEDLLESSLYVLTSKTSVTLPDTQVGRLYAIAVIAAPKNTDYASGISQIVYAAHVCATPKIVGTYEDGKPAADWNDVEGADVYLVYRSTKSNKGFEYIGYVEGPGFMDVSAVKGKTYYYKVTAVCWVGEEDYLESAFSNTIKLKSKS